MRFFITLTNGQQRRIVFKHPTEEKTICRMDCIDPQTKRWVPWLSATATCAVCDQPNRWLGRKISLGRIVRANKNKLDRHLIWKAYFSMLASDMFKKSKWALTNAITVENMPVIFKECVKLSALWQGVINPKCKCKKELRK
jgi:hypothetical protein